MPISQWLEALPDGYRERALRAHDDMCSGTGGGRKQDCLSRAISSGISWARTREGAIFWGYVHDHFAFRDSRGYSYVPLPELPTTNKPRLRR